jgi:hypothetical protein
LTKKEVINDPKLFNAKLFELEILRTDDSKEEISYFTELFYDLLSLFTKPFQEDPLIFLMRPFENIAKLENDFKDTNLEK